MAHVKMLPRVVISLGRNVKVLLWVVISMGRNVKVLLWVVIAMGRNGCCHQCRLSVSLLLVAQEE